MPKRENHILTGDRVVAFHSVSLSFLPSVRDVCTQSVCATVRAFKVGQSHRTNKQTRAKWDVWFKDQFNIVMYDCYCHVWLLLQLGTTTTYGGVCQYFQQFDVSLYFTLCSLTYNNNKLLYCIIINKEYPTHPGPCNFYKLSPGVLQSLSNCLKYLRGILTRRAWWLNLGVQVIFKI